MLSWALLNESDGWLSNVLIEIGATLLLFAPLLVLGKRVEKRLDQVQQTAEQIEVQQEKNAASIATLAEEVTQAQATLQRTRDELNELVRTRLADERTSDRTLFEKIETEPSGKTIEDALEKARELGLITPIGCRVRIGSSEMYVRFNHEARQVGDSPSVIVSVLDTGAWVESRDRKSSQRVSFSRDIAEFMNNLVTTAISMGLYPGDRMFDAAQILVDLRTLLEISYESSTNSKYVEPIGPIFEYFSPQWAITEAGTVCTEPGNRYSIVHTRLNESDWYQHVSVKPWVNEHAFTEAYLTATALFKAGTLPN